MLRAVFEGEKYASYIALMRELRLEREFEDGDWLIDSAGFVGLYYGASISYGDEPKDAVWLPRLDQWLSLLEAAGERDICFSQGHPDALPDEWCCGTSDHWEGGFIYTGNAPTREEAAARCWLSATGRSATT